MKGGWGILVGLVLGAGGMYVALERGHDAAVTPASENAETNVEAIVAKSSVPSSAVTATASPVVPRAVQAIAPGDRQDWLSSIRTNDPVRYQEIVTRREEARKTTEYELAKRAAYFLNREDHTWTKEQAEEYQRMLKLLHESLDLTEKLKGDLTEDERREITWAIRRNMWELAPLLETERDAELYRIGKEIGYSDDDAAAFVLYLRDVIDMTSVGAIFRNSMRAMGGGGWWGRGERDERGPASEREQ